MGHNINHVVLPKDVDKGTFLAEVCEEVEHEDWEEGGSYGGPSSLFNKSHWHDDKVYPNREAAEKAIDEFDKGWYDDHAVLFRDLDSLKDTKGISNLRTHIDGIREKKAEYFSAHAPRERKSKLAACPRCGSKVSVQYVDGYDCPVCRKSNAFMSPTVEAALARYDERIAKDERSIRELQEKHAKRAPVCWLAKYEYHV